MEFESTEKTQAPPSQVCIVYDPRDGRIVHGHVFVGEGSGLFGPDGREARERETLDGARRNHGDVSYCRTVHVPAGFRFERNVAYRVDPKTERLVEHCKWPSEKSRPDVPPATRT